MLNNLFKKKTITKTIKENEIISLHKLPIGKHPFIGTVSKISFDNNTNAGKQMQYLYLEKLKIRIGNTWFDVECSGNAIRIKMGKKLKGLHLKKNNILAFKAQVVSKDIEFDKVEEFDDIKPNSQYCEPHAVLPESYNGNITVYKYNNIVTKHYSCWHSSSVEILDKEAFYCQYNIMFNAWYEEPIFKDDEEDKVDGIYKEYTELYSMFYEGRELKHLSNIVPYKLKKGGKI